MCGVQSKLGCVFVCGVGGNKNARPQKNGEIELELGNFAFYHLFIRHPRFKM